MDEAAQPAPPTQPSPPPPPESRERRGILIVVVLALVAIAGIVAWSIGNDDAADELGRVEERFPTPTTQPPPTTAAPATTVPPTPAPTATPPATAAPVTEPVVTEPPTTPLPTSTTTTPPATTAAPVAPPTTDGTGPAPTQPDEPEVPGIVTGLVPNLAAYPEYLATPEQAQVAIAALLVDGRHDVAAVGPADTICAAVRLTQPLAVDSRWERDGRRLTSSDLGRRDAPGFGECLGNGGAPLEDGSYQYVAIDAKGNESAAGGIVIGAARVEQPFLNDTTEAVCAIRVAPSASRYFEVYVYGASPIPPGGGVTIPVADVRQDAETVGCDDEVVARFTFDPDAAVAQPLGG